MMHGCRRCHHINVINSIIAIIKSSSRDRGPVVSLPAASPTPCSSPRIRKSLPPSKRTTASAHSSLLNHASHIAHHASHATFQTLWPPPCKFCCTSLVKRAQTSSCRSVSLAARMLCGCWGATAQSKRLNRGGQRQETLSRGSGGKESPGGD